jgi:ABC-type antimicrobial peptide transport system permease subunit
VIVGVVRDIALDGLTEPGVAMFSPLSQGWRNQLNLFAKTPASAAAIAPRIRQALRAADPAAAPDVMPTTLEEQLYASTAQPRHWATILIVFAVAALAMAAVGVFGLLSYAVELRRREIGVRMALGAQSSRVVSSIIAGGMRCAAIGAALGIGITLVASRWMRTLLFEVSAVDPPTLLAATAGLLAVAVAACWIPARRAARIDPTEAMRGE